MDVPNCLQMTAKLALAIAIIRNKPEGKSSRQYTEELAKRVSDQEVWKAKVTALEAEVLHLQQELLLHKIHNTPILENENISLTPDLQEPRGNLEPMNLLQDDSGCDISNEDGVDALTASQSSNNCDQTCRNLSHSSTPLNHLPIIKSFSFGEEQLSSQIHFLNHLLGLGKLTAAQSYVTDFTKFGNDCTVVTDSVSGLLNGLVSFYKTPKPSVLRVQTEAFKTITNLLTNSHLPKNILQECLKSLEDFERQLIQSVLTNESINRFQMQQYKVDSLHQLGKCHMLRGPLINLLFSEVKNCVGDLLQPQVQAKYNITKYENMSLLCTLLENLLQRRKEDEEGLHCKVLDSETKLFVQNLDHTVLQISDGFPLLSLILWRLGTLVSYIEN
ncbi:meiosis-specific protein MEI4 isoform X2 [Hyla sarda]|uniref:meiosis-specific protein MEI4 isoform X2 n=1 Tax=Hyla sarda TaxID=327740 RepID=UPI0024C3A1F1|nr:meiosis-specific protein MEI4 isoform X2 [Hyla sarda]